MKILLALLWKYWKPLVIFLLVALSLWGYGQWRYTAGENAKELAWSKKWADRKAADSEASRKKESEEREEEQRRQQDVNEEQKRADDELAKAQADADAAQLAGDGMQKQLALLQRQLAGSETGRLSALADASAAKAETARVLAELLSESDKRAGIYAAEADRAYIAGSTCERIYDKVTGSENGN